MRGGPKTQSARPYATSANGHSLSMEEVAAQNLATTSSTTLESSTMLHLNEIYDPFSLSTTLTPNPSASLASNLTNSGIPPPLHIGAFGRRKPGPRAQPGLPPAHYLVTSGAYTQFGKSLAGLSALRGDEIDGDLGEVRRKRVRTAQGGARRKFNME